MDFITARELRLNTADLWAMLDKEREIVVTLNGKPVALLTEISGENLEVTLRAVRKARGEWAIRKLQESAVARGLDRMTDEEIDHEIRQARKDRKR
jgi:antitoxin (DNA-binding transcriptional repressor) of toxin-antitoxin stability system